MLHELQTIIRHTLNFQAEANEFSRQEVRFAAQNPEHFGTARIVCADGFSVSIAVNKDNFGKSGLPISSKAEVLHDMFHQAAGAEKCNGLSYNFS